MAPETSPVEPQSFDRPRRSSTLNSVANSVQSITGGVQHVATDILRSDPPPGFFAATAGVASRAPTFGEIRRGSFDANGWQSSGDSGRRKRTTSRTNADRRSGGKSGTNQFLDAEGTEAFPALTEEPSQIDYGYTKNKSFAGPNTKHANGSVPSKPAATRLDAPADVEIPKKSWAASTATGLLAFWKWFCTPFGFLLTIYGLNVVAWGGMLFLLLCNASKPMCWAPIPNANTQGQRSPAAALALNSKYPRYYNCNDINSPRRVWLEIDSQILNALFCVTGFGLIPWRFRDLWYLLRWRFTSEKRHGRAQKLYGLRTLAGIYNGWFRLPGSETLDDTAFMPGHSEDRLIGTAGAHDDLEAGNKHSGDLRVPSPPTKAPPPPISGARAPPTALWKVDFFVWSQVVNTFMQACLCGFMWGMNRYDRPSWATGLFIGLAFVIAGLGGFVSYLEGRKIKRIEGVTPKQAHALDSEQIHEPGNGTKDSDLRLRMMDSEATGRESVHVDETKGKPEHSVTLLA
ncbi:hypothetical protein LTR78_010437 [Recurvomyces mirabilis]|uniref:Uncharacterized protein n=1 Tax=Recurvomyces mirabilis TaxID=574656 RepID=A0AAE0WHZ6_9PEZI|nr:hypothetical protein LTR78_010437 [Recurvomyces mirabilis]KAK5150516.1 hypothetical protein LTS14_010009 [Recurvomyces mirabilis]